MKSNPFLTITEPSAWGPGSFEMAQPLVEACNITTGMRILEVGGGSGQIASVLAKYWNVQVIVLEPWTDGKQIQQNAESFGVSNQVYSMRLKAQEMPFADNTFDAIISIGSFEMIGEERPIALKEMIRVARDGAKIGIAEPMCKSIPMPLEMKEIDEKNGLGFSKCFSTLEWNIELFSSQRLKITEAKYFTEAYHWWLQYSDQAKISEEEKQLIVLDQDRWLSLGMVVGQTSKNS